MPVQTVKGRCSRLCSVSSLSLRVVSQFGPGERLQEEWNVGRVTPGLNLSDFFLEDLRAWLGPARYRAGWNPRGRFP